MTDEFTRSWIIEKTRDIIPHYPAGLTVRQLHYRLVTIGMTNDINHYKRVVSAMTQARWDGIVSMEAFIDRERSMYWHTHAEEKLLDDEIENAKKQIKAWMTAYCLNRWSNQKKYVEVGVEKKALQGVFETTCMVNDVGLAPYKGYSSITFLNEARKRFKEAIYNGQNVIILYFGDYDPSGEDIPRSIEKNLKRMGIEVTLKRIALNPDQIRDMNLPGVPPKLTDSRTRNWEGDRVVELDAVDPNILAEMCKDAVKEHFDLDRYHELKDRESDERQVYKEALKKFVKDLKEED